MKREIQTRILTLKNPSSRRISIKNSNPRSHGFLSFTFFGKCKRVPVNSGLAICSLRVTISACLRSSSVHESKEKVSTTPICFCFLLQNLPSSHLTPSCGGSKGSYTSKFFIKLINSLTLYISNHIKYY